MLIRNLFNLSQLCKFNLDYFVAKLCGYKMCRRIVHGNDSNDSPNPFFPTQDGFGLVALDANLKSGESF